MKKNIVLLLCLTVVTTLFVSCNKWDEDAYYPKQKLSKVEVLEFNNLTLVDFLYDGKLLSKINVNIDINDNLLLDVVYDGKQISEIVDPIEGMRIKFTYQDEKLVRLEYADAEEVYSYSVFTRNAAGKIATVNSYILEDDYDDWSKRCQSPLFQLAFDAKSIQKMLDMNGSKGNFEMESQSAWTYSGDNIVSVVSTYDSYGETMTVKDTYEYDENPNPYFGLPYILFENVSYSKNNVTAQHTEYQISGVSISAATKNYQYTYDNKKYPVMAEETDENGNKVGTTNYTYLQ